MNDHDFEQKLQRQPLRPVPSHWRSGILAAAKGVKTAPSRSGFGFRISNLLWPSPYAWGGLAAVWVLILIVNFSPGSESRIMAQKAPAPSPQLLAAVREQKQMLSELLGQPETPPTAEPPRRLSPQPRSDRRTKISIV